MKGIVSYKNIYWDESCSIVALINMTCLYKISIAAHFSYSYCKHLCKQVVSLEETQVNSIREL